MPWDFWIILVLLAVVLPWRGRQRMRALLALPQVSGRERIRLYLSTLLFQWALAAVIFWRARARGLTAAEMGLTVRHDFPVVFIAVAGALLIALAHWKNLRRMAGLDHPAAQRMRALAVRIFPRTPPQLWLYAA